MTPYQTAAAIYNAPPLPECPLSLLVEACLQWGVVISTPRIFLIAAPCRVDDPPDVQSSIPLKLSPTPDCWHVFLASGELAALPDLVFGYRLPWVSYFRRGGHLRRVSFDSLLAAMTKPKMPAPPPPPPPPVQSVGIEAQAAELDAKTRAKRRVNFSKSILAPPASDGLKSTLV